jgi:hypothetical protein
MIDNSIWILTIFLMILSFLFGFLINMKSSEEKCPKCNSKVDVSYEYGKSYEIKKCTSCKWKTKRDMNVEIDELENR